MSEHIPEKDWKRLRDLKVVALDRLCASILSECAQLTTTAGQTNHERFLALYRHIHERNEDIAQAFDDLRRSTAIPRLAAMYALGLLTSDELGQFTEETQESVRGLADLSYR